LARHRERRTERARRVGVGQRPGAVGAGEGSTARERERPPIPGTGGRFDERLELGGEQPRPLLRVYFFFRSP
jgi:hypothetical protein